MGILSSLFPEVPREKLADLLPYNEPPREYPGWFAAKSHEILRGLLPGPGRHAPAYRAAYLATCPQATGQPAAPGLPSHEDNRSSRRRLQRQAQKLSQARDACAAALLQQILPLTLPTWRVRMGVKKPHSHEKRGRREKVPLQSSWYGLVGAGFKPAMAHPVETPQQ